MVKKIGLSLQCDLDTKVEQLNITIMKTMNFKSEQETERKVIELTMNGVKFRVTGRTKIVII